MSHFTAGIIAVMSVFFAGTVLAIQPGKTVTWDTPMGKVVFDGKNHFDAKVKCLECHSKIFKMKKGSTDMKMADINAGKFCGKCHNGKRAFEPKDNCDICHKK
ncbi:MAG: cytochrome c3 family protein [Desulfuromonadales bacterium]